ncbi:MAG: cobalt-precorrin-5B (C(1))-methyltransferase CbiD [Clostridiales bacterium]|nr:cobalt-precorrin-5B (C(1))-methyltransferase CbiD [Clostridiales bacterium]
MLTENGLQDQYIIRGDRKLRFGYTTGSCAAAATQAAARMLFSRKAVDAVRLTTPKGITLFLEPLFPRWDDESASCAIQKDAGDDPDVTDGILIYAQVRKCGGACRRQGENGCETGNMSADDGQPDIATVDIRGGEGIGTVTLPGLEQPVGTPAINRVPRQMIAEEVQAVCEEFGYTGSLEVTISAPEGRRLAEQTFNPRLGIEGGISILGTSGIVEPMSEQAVISTIELELRQKAVRQRYIPVTPGNYGADYLNVNFPVGPEAAVTGSYYVAQTIDLAFNLELDGLLFVAHIGKFVKVAGGIMNTHSREADARMEILSAAALRAGIDANRARQILDAVTTDEGLRIIHGTDAWQPTLDILTEKIEYHLNRRAQGRLKVGAVIFSKVYGELGRTRNVPELLEKMGGEP